MDLETWVSTLAIISAMFALYFSLRRELKSDIADVRTALSADIARVDDRVSRVDARISTLDDRVYALAVGLRPVIDEAAARAAKG